MAPQDVYQNVLNFISETFSTDNILDHLGISSGIPDPNNVIGQKNTFEQFGTNVPGLSLNWGPNGQETPIYSDSLPSNKQLYMGFPGLGGLNFQPPKEVIEGDRTEADWMNRQFYPTPEHTNPKRKF